MGKILTYLGVSEEGQSRDVLDAERILEGMQMIYSAAPDGSKKNNFAIPLAEMTKVFIEKVKGIKPKEQPKKDLPFKVGDVFKQALSEETEKEYGISTFTILSIDEKNEKVKIGRKNLKSGESHNFERDINKVIEDVEMEWWIPYKEEVNAELVAGVLAAVNKVFIKDKEVTENVIYQNELFQNQYVDRMNIVVEHFIGNDSNLGNFLKSLSTNEKNKNDLFNELYELRDLNLEEEDFYPDLIVNYLALKGILDVGYKNMYKIRFNNTPKKYLNPKFFDKLTFKVGDKFIVKSNPGTIFTIKDINVNDDKVTVLSPQMGDVIYRVWEVTKFFEEGSWIKINEDDTFKVGDKFKIKNEDRKEGFEVIDISGDRFSFKMYDGDVYSDIYTTSEANQKLKDGKWFKVNDEQKPQEPKKEEPKSQEPKKEEPKSQEPKEEFKVGDKLLDKKLNQVLVITKLDAYAFKYKMIGENFEFSTTKENARRLVEMKSWTRIKDEEMPESKYKVGDKFKDTKVNDIVQIAEIRGGSIFLVDDNGLTISYSERELDMGIKSGLYIKVEEKKTRKPRTPRAPSSDKDKQIQHILDINLEDIDF